MASKSIIWRPCIYLNELVFVTVGYIIYTNRTTYSASVSSSSILNRFSSIFSSIIAAW